MAAGYEDSRFETKVDVNLHCVICTEVLKDPVQCSRNEHHFCSKCIAKHLKHMSRPLDRRDTGQTSTIPSKHSGMFEDFL